MKKETHGVFSRGAGGLLASCLFFSFLMTLCGLACLGIQKSLLNGSCNYKGKAHLIPLLGFVIIFRLEKHFWTHPMLLKYFFFTSTTISGIFWCLIIQRLYALYFFLGLCYVHPLPYLIWPKIHHAFSPSTSNVPTWYAFVNSIFNAWIDVYAFIRTCLASVVNASSGMI